MWTIDTNFTFLGQSEPLQLYGWQRARAQTIVAMLTAYEADQQSQYVLFGTALPPQDPEVRDDGSFVPAWKQEVRDERGRKRLHGAFTGGWSAGYFNTVGSKEGWTPSAFVSSRLSQRQEDSAQQQQQRPEDFMDDEDLADAAEAQKIQTSDSFAGLGATQTANGSRSAAGLAGLFHTDGETMGVKLLQKMGWKQGQGIGPKVRRKARLDLKSTPQDKSQTYLFAPENVSTVRFSRKVDHKGLGFDTDYKLSSRTLQVTRAENESESEEEYSLFSRPKLANQKNKKGKSSRGGIGMGVLNDTGSDDEDPYEIGPKISSSKVIGGDKKRKKSLGLGSSSSNPSVKSTSIFMSRKNAASRALRAFRRCHDGRLPITGFVFGVETDPLTAAITVDGKYPPPRIPIGWKSVKSFGEVGQSGATHYKTTADAAKESQLNPVSRAELLEESPLPGKSVFDFLTSSARDRLAAASGKVSLPPGRGEIPAEYAMSEEEKASHLFSQVPRLEKETAVAAIARGSGPGTPYSEDEDKRGRYRRYLEYHAGYAARIPSKPRSMKDGDWVGELQEFYSCARIFKPMVGAIASRFTTSSSNAKITTIGSSRSSEGIDLVSRPAAKATDPAEDAAKLGMYGPLTRSVEDFFPTRLLCKRFNVKPPPHVQPDAEQRPPQARSRPVASYYGGDSFSASSSTGPPRDDVVETQNHRGNPVMQAQDQPSQDVSRSTKPELVLVDASMNEALEGKRAQEEVLKAIFGDSDDEEDGGFIRCLVARQSYRMVVVGANLFLPVFKQELIVQAKQGGLCIHEPPPTPATATFHLPSTSNPSPTVDSSPIAKLSDSAEPIQGQSVSVRHSRPETPQGPKVARNSGRDSPKYSLRVAPNYRQDGAGIKRQAPAEEEEEEEEEEVEHISRARSPPPQYPASEASGSRPPPFDFLYAASEHPDGDNGDRPTTNQAAGQAGSLRERRLNLPSPSNCYPHRNHAVIFHAYEPRASSSAAAPAYAPIATAPSTFDHPSENASLTDLVADTKQALPQDPKGERSGSKDDDGEPPPAYSEGDSPLLSFAYVMSAAGGASSIITQVQQGGPPINAIGDVGADETITMDLRGTRFVLSRDELLTLPEFVLLSLFPNGLFPEGHMGGFGDNDAVQVDYDPASLHYMLEFFRDVAQSIPVESSPEPSSGGEEENRDDSSKRAGIIVLREDLDFYAIPPRADISQAEMIEVKRAAAKALLQQSGIFSGLKKSDEPGTTEAHLIEMLTAGGFNHDDNWGHRAGEPNKAVICSLALARLRSDIRGNEMGTNAVGMAQKLLLFWRKPARRCWWEGVELDNVEGVEGKLKVWIRRVWTLEMSVIGLR
ncbi:putative g patch domain-containing protein 1 protein [Zalerion maritima]|uniref:G patch domain-containing protein 1 protein n=1 Tax=Zalerion maritima TaxID=339359 RepID=A0AAD5RHQ4_9PEZI|nr:putative g patch domain-containing protein 1 protein [Zalerion maritima]